MLIQHILPYVKINLKFSNKICSSFFELDKKTLRFKCIESRNKLRYLKFHIICSILDSILMATSIHRSWDKTGFDKLLPALVIVVFVVGCTVMRLSCYIFRKEMANLVNGMIAYEKQRLQGMKLN